MARQPPDRPNRPPIKKRRVVGLRRSIRKLTESGARDIANEEELKRLQASMLTRFAKAEVPHDAWRQLRLYDAKSCHASPCSAACLFGDRSKVNSLLLEAGHLLEASGKPLAFVTIIDPNIAIPVGQLRGWRPDSLLQSLRRRIREAPDVFATTRAFGFVEVAIEVRADGKEFWTPHLHFVMEMNADRSAVKTALQPRRPPPSPGDWSRTKWKRVEVKPVTGLANLLAYIAKRKPDLNVNGSDHRSEHTRNKGRLTSAHMLEYDLWLLDQKPKVVFQHLQAGHARGPREVGPYAVGR